MIPKPILLALLAAPLLPCAAQAFATDSALLRPASLSRTEPLALRFTAPEDERFWAQVEAPARRRDDPQPRGAVTLGRDLPVLDCAATGMSWCGGLRLGLTPLVRSIPDAPRRGGTGPMAGFGLAQSLDYEVSPALTLRAGADLGDRLGIAAPLVPGGSGLAVKARVGLGADLGLLGLPLRVDATLALVRDLGGAAPGPRPHDCEGALDIRLADYAPLRLTLPCGPGGGTRIGLGLRGEF